MKKMWLAALLAAVLALPGCGGREKAFDGDGLKVYASFFPMYELARMVGGERAQVALLIPPGTEPHDWEPSPSDLVALGEADIFVYNGVGLESFVEGIAEAAGNPDLAMVETAAGLSLLANAEEDEHQEEEEEDDHGAYDPHVWLSPALAKEQMKAVLDAFCQADPDNADYYTENFDAAAARLDALDAEYRERLSGTSSKLLVTAHGAFGYLCREYGLTQVALEGFSAESEPSPRKMAELSDLVRDSDVTTVFFEASASSRTADAIANETGAKTGVLYTLETPPSGKLDGTDDYFSLMEKNLDALEEALK